MSRTWYWAIGIVVVVLCVVGLITYGAKQSDEEAQAKAQELVTKFDRAGLPVPEDLDILTRSLGADGGAVCDNPASALGKALIADQVANGASFVGRRPVLVDRRFLLGQALILETYCPEELQEFRDEVLDKYEFDDTADL